MNIPKHRVFMIFILSFFVFILMIFRNILLENILKPFALTIWIVLRHTILSINQEIIWWVIIIICALVFLFRIKWWADHDEHYESEAVNLYERKYLFCKSYFLGKASDPFNQNRLQQTLQELFISLYAVRKHLAHDYELTDAFKLKKIQLPENIYSFLFIESKNDSFFSIKRIRNKLSGRDVIEYNQKLDECLSFIENYTETEDEH